ncbi:hypothetical protein [Peribacillus frigoritolerans]|uniref:hypothetical protein n=1 Tax=Peribacillus frigoritolerans TaxID=450367 RepID=UPI000A89FA40|nr:hypothetical protein [Peribacillus frigoritolerans]MCY9141902.1 hypothetical protein [Peribacillus frigoritolerans]
MDFAQQLYAARAVNFRGVVVVDHLHLIRSEDGFAGLLKWMEAAIVGMEPTGITH